MKATTIRNAIESIALAKLGPDFKVLPYIFDVESNDDRNLINGISVLWGDVSQIDGVDQVLNIEQEFNLRLTLRTFVQSNDSKSIARVDGIYDAVGEILKSCVLDRMDLDGTVHKVTLGGVSAPRPFNQNQRETLSIEVRFSVYYLLT